MTIRRIVTLGLMLLIASQARAQGTVAGTLFDSLRANRPLGGATVTIAELGRYAQTDARGRFHFDSLPGGHYTLSFFDSPLDSLGLAAPRVLVDVPAQGVVDVHLATPAPLSLLRALCGQGADTASGAVVGTVRAVDDASAMAGVIVVSQWTELALRTRQRHALTARTRSNGAGGYVLCRLPRDIPVDLTVEGASHAQGKASVEIGDDYVVRRDFALGRTVAAVGAIRGTVKTARGKPAVNAVVEIPGTEAGTRTDSAGRFVLLKVPAGTQTLEARLLGSSPIETTIDVPGDGWVSLDLALGRDVQALPTATIIGRATAVDLSGFDLRRRAGSGEFMTASDIKRHGFVHTSEALYRFSSLQAAYLKDEGEITPNLAFVQRSVMGSRCIPRYYIDGMPEPDILNNPVTGLDHRFRTEELRGIEVHTAWDAPVQFPPDPRDGCGVVLIWTK
jgi:hypothetical protein